MRRTWESIAAVFLPLFAGGGIYLLFRSRTLVMFRWVDALGLGGPLDVLRRWTIPMAEGLPDILLYSAPDGLWAFSYACLCMWIWNGGPLYRAISWALLVPLVAFFSEVGQLAGWVRGTYDPWDLLCYVVGGGAPVWWYVRKQYVTA